MAKKVGSEDTSAAPRPAAEVHNIVVTEESFLNAVKEISLKRAAVESANTSLKQTRKKWKASGIELGALDRAVKMAEWSRGEVRDAFDIERRYARWLGLPVEGRQPTLFKGMKDEEIQRREWHALGRTFSRTGKPGRPPEEVPEEFHQAFMRGYNEEDEAAWSDSEAPDVQESGDQPVTQPGGVFVVQKGREVAPGDPAATAEPPVVGVDDQPDWSAFAHDPADWNGTLEEDFRRWYDSLLAGQVVRISHPGILKAFRAARDDEMREEGQVVAERMEDAPRLDGETWPPAEPPLPPAAAPAAKGKGKGGKGLH